jgi:hypothetical protein
MNVIKKYCSVFKHISVLGNKSATIDKTEQYSYGMSKVYFIFNSVWTVNIKYRPNFYLVIYLMFYPIDKKQSLLITYGTHMA